MTPLGGVLVAASFLLFASGAGKITRPQPTERSLRGVGLPSRRWFVLTIGLVEIVAGTAALVVPGPVPAIAVAIMYAAFAGFVVLVLRSDSDVGCGCFGGNDDEPPGWLHLGVVLAASVASAASAGSDAALVDVVADDLGVGIATAVSAATLAVLARGVLTALSDNRSVAATIWTGRPPTGDS